MPESIEPTQNNQPAAPDIIEPLEGLEEKTWSLPQLDEKGEATDFKDDWLMVDEKADSRGELFVKLQRYEQDGSVDTRVLRMGEFDDLQAKRHAELTFQQARIEELGASATRMSMIGMIRNSEAYVDKNSGAADAQAEILKLRQARHAKSLEELEAYKNQKRRENPLKYMLRGKHRKGINKTDFDL